MAATRLCAHSWKWPIGIEIGIAIGIDFGITALPTQTQMRPIMHCFR
jgi:hypothetical protein